MKILILIACLLVPQVSRAQDLNYPNPTWDIYDRMWRIEMTMRMYAMLIPEARGFFLAIADNFAVQEQNLLKLLPPRKSDVSQSSTN